MKALKAFLIGVLLSVRVYAQDSADDSAIPEVLVSGERPGPGLWKVTKGNHTMWVLGIQAPLAKDMKWRSAEVERVIAQSQEVLGAGGVVTDIKIEGGFVDAFKSAAALSRLKKNPGEAKLEDVVPADVYAQWTRLKARYLGRDRSVEKQRPLFAAIELEEAALKKFGFERRPSAEVVVSVIVKAAKDRGLSANGPAYKVKVQSSTKRSEVIKNTTIPADDDLECFKETLNGLEAKLELLRDRANAWAVGDIEALIRLNQSETMPACTQRFGMALFASADGNSNDYKVSAKRLESEWYRGMEYVKQRWVAAAESALARNETTFSYLTMSEVVGANGRLEMLRKKGYTIEPPR